MVPEHQRCFYRALSSKEQSTSDRNDIVHLKSSSGKAKGHYLFPNFLCAFTIKCAFHGYWLRDNVGANFCFTSNSSAAEFPHLMLVLVSLFLLNCPDFCLDLHLLIMVSWCKMARIYPPELTQLSFLTILRPVSLALHNFRGSASSCSLFAYKYGAVTVFSLIVQLPYIITFHFPPRLWFRSVPNPPSLTSLSNFNFISEVRES
ncbi:Glutathione S-transferase [Trichinella pseudospiralis]